jgi:hypothetical protein
VHDCRDRLRRVLGRDAEGAVGILGEALDDGGREDAPALADLSRTS